MECFNVPLTIYSLFSLRWKEPFTENTTASLLFFLHPQQKLLILTTFSFLVLNFGGELCIFTNLIVILDHSNNIKSLTGRYFLLDLYNPKVTCACLLLCRDRYAQPKPPMMCFADILLYQQTISFGKDEYWTAEQGL